MGIGGWVYLGVLAVALALYARARGYGRKKPLALSEAPEPGLSQIHLEKAPLEMSLSLTPKWEAELTPKVAAEGWVMLGDWSYTSMTFFFARAFLSPDGKTVMLWVNWVEGKGGFKQVVTNLELYSFLGDGNFLLTAACQDGAARLLTGANRPPEDKLRLKLQAVFSELDTRPLMEAHAQWVSGILDAGWSVRKLATTEVKETLESTFKLS